MINIIYNIYILFKDNISTNITYHDYNNYRLDKYKTPTFVEVKCKN